MNLFSVKPLGLNAGLFLIRVLTGSFLLYHGWEIFNGKAMQEYAQWDAFKNMSYPTGMVYAGKFFELAGGALLVLGLVTRLASLMAAGTLGYITFVMGNGKIWSDDQYPFLFVMLLLVFICTGPGTISVDAFINKQKLIKQI